MAHEIQTQLALHHKGFNQAHPWTMNTEYRYFASVTGPDQQDRAGRHTVHTPPAGNEIQVTQELTVETGSRDS